MRTATNAYEGDKVLIGELYLPLERLMTYYGAELDGVHLPQNFGLTLLSEWKPEAIGSLIGQYGVTT